MTNVNPTDLFWSLAAKLSLVDELIAAGVGRPFAPAKRVFKEWVAVPEPSRRRWESLLREGIALARTKVKGKPRRGKATTSAR